MKVIAVVLLAACSSSSTVAPVTRPAADRGPPATLPPIHDALDACRQHNLEAINALRTTAGSKPLVLDDTLTAFAQEGSVWEARDGVPHGHSKAKSRELFRGTYRHENQGPIDGVLIVPADLIASCKERIDGMLERMMSRGPGEGHHDAILDPRHAKLGVGLHIQGDRMWITNDFME